MKIISIVGARPEFIQATPISHALQKLPNHREVLVHTGQHYDYLMSQTFFDELNVPAPNYNLEVGSGLHGQQTAEILSRMEAVFLKEKPDLVIIRGDTNSTLSGALAAGKLHIPAAHIEAGERSYNRHMPEEINRLVADCLANIHFCVSQAAVHRLAAEGIFESVHVVGDVMLDVMLKNRALARQKSDILNKLKLTAGAYALVTIHRAANTDNPAHLKQIVTALNNVAETIVFPAHPRTKKALNKLGVRLASHIKLIEPVGYFDMVTLEDGARLIATDSGGVQREAYFLSIPCLTLRNETEWVETVSAGWNKLVGAGCEQILDAWSNFAPPTEHPPIFGDGTAGHKIVQLLTTQNITFG